MVASDIEIEGDRDVALIGRAAHEALAVTVKGGDPDFGAIAKTHGVERNSFAPLYYIGRRIWDEYRGGLAVIAIEKQMAAEILPGVTLQGTGDIIARAVQEAVPTIVPWDWKSGAMADHRDQLIGYAWLATREWPAEHVKGVLCWLRDQVADVDDIGMDEVERLPERIREALDHPDRFCPGPDQCLYCPRRFDCPARTALVRQSIESLVEASAASKSLGLIALDPAALAALWPKVRMIKGAMAQYDEVVRARVEEAGSLPVGDGTELVLKDVERTQILAAQGLPVLIERFGGLEAVMPAIRLGNEEVADLAKAGAPRGGKKAAVEELMAELKAAEAVVVTHSKRLAAQKEGKSNGTERGE
jgi:hypothetical protein